MKRVLILGVFSFESTDSWKKRAFERLGWRTVAWPYRDRSIREFHHVGEPFDLVLVSKGVPMTVEEFAHARTLGTQAVLWWPDPVSNVTPELVTALATGAWDLSATSSVVLAKIVELMHSERKGVAGLRVHRILEGADCEGPMPAPEVIEPSLLHFGALTERRQRIIDELRAAGVPVNCIPPTYGIRLQREVVRHAAVLGLNSSPDLISNRFLTVVAMGGAILQEMAAESQFTMEDLGGMLTPGSIGFFNGFRNLEQCIEFARLRIRNPHVYRDAETAGRIYGAHSWEASMGRLIEAVGA